MSSNEKIFSVLRAPRISEKTARLQELSNQYVFEVSTEATKADVKAAIEKLFDVKVEAVNVVNVKGKSKTFRNRATTTKSSPRCCSRNAARRPWSAATRPR